MKHLIAGEQVRNVRFCPFEDVLGVGRFFLWLSVVRYSARLVLSSSFFMFCTHPCFLLFSHTHISEAPDVHFRPPPMHQPTTHTHTHTHTRTHTHTHTCRPLGWNHKPVGTRLWRAKLRLLREQPLRHCQTTPRGHGAFFDGKVAARHDHARPDRVGNCRQTPQQGEGGEHTQSSQGQ
jgi:BING4CT (NUC141) domain